MSYDLGYDRQPRLDLLSQKKSPANHLAKQTQELQKTISCFGNGVKNEDKLLNYQKYFSKTIL